MRLHTNKLELIALLLCLSLSTTAFLVPELLTEYLQPIINEALRVLGASLFLLVNGLLVAVIVIAFSPLGKQKVGGSNAQVEFGLFGWLSMLFAAGMGSGLIFWGVAEPALNVVNSPLKQSLYPNETSSALALTLINWGAHAWALYAVFGLVLGGVTNTGNGNVEISAPVISALKGVINAKNQRKVIFLVKLVAVLAIFFGVVGTIANSTMLLRKGIEMHSQIESALV